MKLIEGASVNLIACAEGSGDANVRARPQGSVDPATGGSPPSNTNSELRPGPHSTKHLADACHELRQPLQTLFLLQGLLGRSAEGEAARTLAARVETSLTAMAAILDRLEIAGPSTSDARARTSRSYFSDAQGALHSSEHADTSTALQPASVVFVVDDDDDLRAALRSVLEADGHEVCDFASCEAFLAHQRNGGEGCLLIDAYLPGMSGLELLQQLLTSDHEALPAIMITGQSDVAMAVSAMKSGAVDFIEKPIGRDGLLTAIGRAVAQSRDRNARAVWRQEAEDLVAGLTTRQREIMELVLAGASSKNIAADLGISQRTVENHRAAIMAKTGVKSLPALVRLAVTAAAAAPVATSLLALTGHPDVVRPSPLTAAE
jgi:FixJ family two-component response regulator